MNAHTTAAPAPLLDEATLPGRTGNLRRVGLVAGAGGLALWGVLALTPATRPAFLPAYLAAYLFFVGIGVGSLAVLMVHHLVGGAWGFVIRRPLEAATMTLPLMALLFLPIALGAHALYPWADLDVVRASEVLRLKARYLNLPWFFIRSAFYLAVWVGLALVFRSGSARQDDTEDPSPTRRSQTLSAPGLIAVFLTVTFAAIDWVMSVEPEWYSSIYGVLVLVGFVLTALCAGVVAASLLAGVRPLSDVARPGGFHDLGNLTLAFVMLWAYMSFSQYLIIWSGNLTEEIPYYLRRTAGGWRVAAASLMAFHFFAPFFYLLGRGNKRDPVRLRRVAVAVLVMHFVNDVWLVLPAYGGRHWLALLALAPAAAGVGGLWLWAFLGQLTGRTLVPRHNPQLAEAFAHHGGGH